MSKEKPKKGMFHLDKMVGGKKVKSGAPASISGPVGGSLIRPTSVGDFNEVDEDSFNISQMPDNMVIEEFERMLENMNLTQEKKEPLINLPMSKKREMLSMNSRNMARTQFHSPADYIQYLSNPDLSLQKKYSCVESLRVALTNNSLAWVQEFGTKGLKQVLSLLNECFRNDNRWEKVQHECIKCLKAIMNNRVGLRNIFEHKEALTLLARSLNPSLPHVMLEAVKLMAAICLIPPDGHEKTLEAITIAGEMKGSERFVPIVQGVMLRNNEQLSTQCLMLINAVISSSDDLDFRMHLRNEFMRVGLSDVLESFGNNISSELIVQVKVFDEYRDEDFDEFAQRFDNLRFELDDVAECFELVKNTVMDTPAEPYLLSIMQHMLCIRDDAQIRPAFYKLIEECVSQIVLHKSGCDPDFRATKRFQIDVEPLIDHLVERSKADEERSSGGFKKELEEALTNKQETEAKLSQAMAHIAQLEEAIKTGTASPSKLPVPPGLVLRAPGQPGPPPPPPPPGGGPPPPPPPPGMGGPPPPPPPPGSGPPPPPPPPGMGGPPPPPPPGGVRAIGPPVPGGLPMAVNQDEILVKLGMKRKKKWVLENPTKRTNWKSVPATQLTKDAFWAKVDEERLASDSLVKSITNKFSTNPGPKTALGSDVNGGLNGEAHPKKTKAKELKVLDQKAAHNLNILLGGILKHIPYEELRRCILQCDTNMLTENLLQSLIQYIPSPDQLNKLKDFEKEYSDLAEAEQFAISIAGIKRLTPRLKSLMFKQRYPELVADCKPHIVAATAACEEIKKSKKLAKILELILLIGNIMNAGTKNEKSVGFDISYLPKLSNTKDRENKATLLHFLVELAERDHPDLLDFTDELLHLDSAARVSVETIQKGLKQMDASVKNLEMDLKNASRNPADKDDRFMDVMGDFCKEARSQCDILMAMAQKMEDLYSELAKYFVFDKQKYTLEEFMNDIKQFKDQFKRAHESLLKDRESVEKQQRAREAREKQDRERAERNAKKKALIDLNAPDDQQGVMDCLLEALSSGSAFNRDQKRKRAPRAAGAERRAQLNRSRSRGPHGLASPNKEIVDILLDDVENAPLNRRHQPHVQEAGGRQRRPNAAASAHASSRERELPSGAAAGSSSAAANGSDEADALLRKLRAL